MIFKQFLNLLRFRSNADVTFLRVLQLPTAPRDFLYLCFLQVSSRSRARTCDPLVNSQLLYLLSYTRIVFLLLFFLYIYYIKNFLIFQVMVSGCVLLPSLSKLTLIYASTSPRMSLPCFLLL